MTTLPLVSSCFIEPLDVLYLRGNKLFGDPGSHGESMIPPWPSVAAGAIRSRMLADDGIDLIDFGQGRVEHPVLGTPVQPGRFAITAFQLARRHADGRVEPLIAPPADLVVAKSGNKTTVRRLRPMPLVTGVCSSGSLPLLPVLAEEERGKAAGGYWLSEAGWRKYLDGQTPNADDLVESGQLWRIDHRVGVGLDVEQRSAADGRLFSMQAVAMKKRELAGFDVGFVASVSGAATPQAGLLRLGGDGRGAALHAAMLTAVQIDLVALARAGRCRIVLTSPGVFENGWCLPGVALDHQLNLCGVQGRLVCATVPRFETISGWDLAQRKPKPASRAVPAGSVYWIDDLKATPAALGKLVARGLWSDPCEDVFRRAEGFNRFTFAVY